MKRLIHTNTGQAVLRRSRRGARLECVQNALHTWSTLLSLKVGGHAAKPCKGWSGVCAKRASYLVYIAILMVEAMQRSYRRRREQASILAIRHPQRGSRIHSDMVE
jgi:hypothetical protein